MFIVSTEHGEANLGVLLLGQNDIRYIILHIILVDTVDELFAPEALQKFVSWWKFHLKLS